MFTISTLCELLLVFVCTLCVECLNAYFLYAVKDF